MRVGRRWIRKTPGIAVSNRGQLLKQALLRGLENALGPFLDQAGAVLQGRLDEAFVQEDKPELVRLQSAPHRTPPGHAGEERTDLPPREVLRVSSYPTQRLRVQTLRVFPQGADREK